MIKKTTKNLKKTEAYPRNPKQLRGYGWMGRLVFFLTLSVFLMLAAVALFYRWSTTPISLNKSPLQFSIQSGASLQTGINNLQNAGGNVESWPLLLLAKYKGITTKIKSGTYEIKSGITPIDLLNQLLRGEVIQLEIVFPEGWTFKQVRARIDAHPNLRHETIGLSEAELLRQIGATESKAEGLFFPDTYRIEMGGSDLKLFAQSYRAMQVQIAQAWATRDPSLHLKNPYEALILASIIEKETGREADRTSVGAVFANRLKKRMLLQTDPTVIYGLGSSFDGNLRKIDLLNDTPYNTYKRAGLPPTPIALPGRASLAAAVQPAQSDVLYFVARGDGTSEFSNTLEAHNRAVNRFQRGH